MVPVNFKIEKQFFQRAHPHTRGLAWKKRWEALPVTVGPLACLKTSRIDACGRRSGNDFLAVLVRGGQCQVDEMLAAFLPQRATVALQSSVSPGHTWLVNRTPNLVSLPSPT